MPTTRLKSSTTRCRVATCRLRNTSLKDKNALLWEYLLGQEKYIFIQRDTQQKRETQNYYFRRWLSTQDTPF